MARAAGCRIALEFSGRLVGPSLEVGHRLRDGWHVDAVGRCLGNRRHGDHRRRRGRAFGGVAAAESGLR